MITTECLDKCAEMVKEIFGMLQSGNDVSLEVGGNVPISHFYYLLSVLLGTNEVDYTMEMSVNEPRSKGDISWIVLKNIAAKGSCPFYFCSVYGDSRKPVNIIKHCHKELVYPWEP